jgi:hypothetical protein
MGNQGVNWRIKATTHPRKSHAYGYYSEGLQFSGNKSCSRTYKIVCQFEFISLTDTITYAGWLMARR